MNIRPAEGEDVPEIVALTRGMRRRLAQWSPVYFNPSHGADDGHAAFLAFVIASPDHEAFVLVDSDSVAGCCIPVVQARHLWIDDLCLADPLHWSDALAAIGSHAASPWVTCVSPADHDRLHAMESHGMRPVSTYRARRLSDITPAETVHSDPPPGLLAMAPAHTFGADAFSPLTPGALVITDAEGGYVVGSPSVAPPIYDPGGPTCVVDRVVGSHRGDLIDRALGASKARGDAQFVVVCDADDLELADLLVARNFETEIVLLEA